MIFTRLFKMRKIEDDRLGFEEQIRRQREQDRFNPYEYERNPYTLLVREQELKLDIKELRTEIDSLERSIFGKQDEKSIKIAETKERIIREQLGRKSKELHQVQKKFNELTASY